MHLVKIATQLTALSLVLLGTQGLGAATTIQFTDQTALDAAFPTRSGTGLYAGPSLTTASSDTLDGPFVSLFAGDRTQNQINAAGRLTIYSDVSYSSELDFINKPLTLTFDGIMLAHSTQAAGYVGNVGVFSANSGAIRGGSANGIYLEISRNTNTFTLVQRISGTTNPLVSWGLSDFSDWNNPTSINAIAIKSLMLTLTDNSWDISATFMKKNDHGTTITKTANGDFATAWTEGIWGSNTYLGLEVNQTATSKSDNIRWDDLQVGNISITGQPIPEPGTAALLTSLIALFFVSGKRLRRRS